MRSQCPWLPKSSNQMRSSFLEDQKGLTPCLGLLELGTLYSPKVRLDTDGVNNNGGQGTYSCRPESFRTRSWMISFCPGRRRWPKCTSQWTSWTIVVRPCLSQRGDEVLILHSWSQTLSFWLSRFRNSLLLQAG